MACIYSPVLLALILCVLNANGKVVVSRTTSIASGSKTVTTSGGKTSTTYHTLGGTYVFITLKRSDGSFKGVPAAIICFIIVILFICLSYRLYLMYHWCNSVKPDLPLVQNDSTMVYVIPDAPLVMPRGPFIGQEKMIQPPGITPWPLQQYPPAMADFPSTSSNLKRSSSDTCLPQTPCPSYDELFPKISSANGGRRYSANLVEIDRIPSPKQSGQHSARDPMNRLQPAYTDGVPDLSCPPSYSPLNREEFFSRSPNNPH